MIEEQKKIGTFPFVIAGISFIPGIGVLFGLVVIVWGLVTKKLGGGKLAIIGACGIAFSVILYGSLFYFGFVKRGGVYDDLRVQLSKSNITSLVQAIEFHKAQNGYYPESLDILQKSLPKSSMVSLYDPSNIQERNNPPFFHYKLDGNDHYYLLGVGPDNKPYTQV